MTLLTQLQKYKSEAEVELKEILKYWEKYSIDNTNGGFYGQITENNSIIPQAPKGSVLNSRILWSFSAAFRQTQNHEYRLIADRAFFYIKNHFIDPQYGGIYWTVDFRGKPLDEKKQIYALAFCIYGLSEYYKISNDLLAKDLSVELFLDIEKYSFDPVKTGYIEAFSREWEGISDARLSEKDANEKKTMNTHLHILEAYTNLFKIWQDNELKEKIILLIKNFTEYIINAKTNHLNLFFNENWVPKSTAISYGHDIEASWLLQEAAEAIQDYTLINKTKELSLCIADAVEDGLDNDGGLWYECEDNHYIKQKHWWPQAEAMVGFMNAWQNSGDTKYLDFSLHAWEFIQKFIKSSEGEWYWGINADYSVMNNQDKVGLWKCPYHNSRACMEIIKRTSSLLTKNLK